MTFQDSITKCFSNYANLQGRASRSEYWWFYLFSNLVNFVVVFSTTLSMGVEAGDIIGTMVGLVLFLPSLAVFARRLHDRNRSGWWILVAFTIIGLIPLFYWLVSEGSKEANEYGEPLELNGSNPTDTQA